MRTQSKQQVKDLLRFETIGQITGGLAHEYGKYNNLLGIIVGNPDMLGECLPKDECVRRQYHTALDASLRAKELTRSLLVSTRLNPLKTGDGDLNEMVSEIVPMVHASLGGLTFVHALLFQEAQFAQIDASELHIAVLNTSGRNRALVVDDEEGPRALAHDWLASMGLDVETASSAEEVQLPLCRSSCRHSHHGACVTHAPLIRHRLIALLLTRSTQCTAW